jgi:septal ring factor EnvC (AmiA/AmiB activator)
MGLFDMQMVIDNIQHQLAEMKQRLEEANKRIEILEGQLKARDGEVEDMVNAFDPCWPEG